MSGPPGGDADATRVPDDEAPRPLDECRPGDRLWGRYEVRSELGRGGMGVVYAARDLELGRDVAVKIVRTGAGDAGREETLRAESQALAALSSRNIVTVYDVRRQGTDCCLVMDRVEGRTLADVLRAVRERESSGAPDARSWRGLVDGERERDRDDLIGNGEWRTGALRILARALRALEEAHEKGIVHRDLKPSNVMLVAGGEPLILDFGLATSDRWRDDGALRGTPSYLPPESFRPDRDPSDPRGDVYQMGLVLHELLTLKQAFPVWAGTTAEELAERIRSGGVPSLAQDGERAPALLEAIHGRATAADPGERYASAAEMRVDLERYLRGLPPKHAPVPAATALSMRARFAARHPVAWLAVLLAVVWLAARAWMPAEAAPAKLEAFVYEKGRARPERVQPGQTLQLVGDAVLGLTVTASAPVHAYAFSVFGSSARRSEQLVLPLRLDRFPPTPGEGSEPRGLAVPAGTTRLTAAVLTEPREYEGLIGFLCDGQSELLDAWLAALWIESEAGRHPVPWGDAWRTGEELLAGRRGRPIGTLAPEELEGWFAALRDAPASEPDAWSAAGILRFDLVFPTTTARARGPGGQERDPGEELLPRAQSESVVEVVPPEAVGRRRALLVGIDRYGGDPAGPGELEPRSGRAFEDLRGAVHDARALAAALQARYGFRPEDVRLLLDGEATRDAILAGFREHLIDASEPGDVALFYFAGHGSEIASSRPGQLEPVDQTLVPFDARSGGRDVWDKELRALLNDLVDRGAHVCAVLDACHSGAVTRGLARPPRARFLGRDARDAAEVYADVPLDARGDPTRRGALVMAAAQGHQPAFETLGDDGRVHGLFSASLLRVLRTAPVDEPAERLFQRVRAAMAVESLRQDPVLSGTDGARARALFGPAAGEGAGATLVAVGAVEAAAGRARLAAGSASGLGRGSRLRALDPDRPAALTVVRVDGLDAAEAEIESGAAEVRPGDLFAVESWGVGLGGRLRVWWPPPLDSGGELGRALAAARALPGAAADPLESPSARPAVWTDGRWERATGEAAVLPLVPPSSALAGALASSLVGDGALQLPDDRDAAHYWLVGRAGAAGAEYAWVAAGPLDRESTEGCPLPARTDWVPLGDDAEAAAADLRLAALRLARVRSWLALDPPPDRGLFPFRLALRDGATGEALEGVAEEGQELVFQLERAGPGASTERRYVFLFVLQSDGSSVLLFPRRDLGGEGNRLPPRGSEEVATIQIPHPRLRVGPPFGVDTFVLLTSRTQLPDPRVLEGPPLVDVDRDVHVADPLARLLAGLRGPSRSVVPTPATWSLERRTIQSRPRED